MHPLLLMIFAAFASATAIHRRSLTMNQQLALNTLLYVQNADAAYYITACDRYNDTSFTSEGFPSGAYTQLCDIADEKQDQIQDVAEILFNSGLDPITSCEYFYIAGDVSSFLFQAYTISSVALGTCLESVQAFSNGNISSAILPTLNNICAALADEFTFVRDTSAACPLDLPFTVPIPFSWAYNLVQPYISYCPTNDTSLPFPLLPELLWESPIPSSPQLSPPIAAGELISFRWDPAAFLVSVSANTSLFLAFVGPAASGPSVTFVEMTVSFDDPFGYSMGEIALPEGLQGIVLVCLTTFSEGMTVDGLAAEGTLAGPVMVLLS